MLYAIYMIFDNHYNQVNSFIAQIKIIFINFIIIFQLFNEKH